MASFEVTTTQKSNAYEHSLGQPNVDRHTLLQSHGTNREVRSENEILRCSLSVIHTHTYTHARAHTIPPTTNSPLERLSLGT